MEVERILEEFDLPSGISYKVKWKHLGMSQAS